MTTPFSQWKKTACIFCSLNCGLEVQTENDHVSKTRGDDDHLASQGYVCEKSQRTDYYQDGADRLDTPMRRRSDDSYEVIDWGTAIREVVERFPAVKRRHGGESILYCDGDVQDNYLGGAYGDSTLGALGMKYRFNALAQEKTGEFWVQDKMFDTGVHGDSEHCEVTILIGKNPWQSHGFAHVRLLLNVTAKDPARSIIVIDPRLSETVALADFHLQIRPGIDAWCLVVLVGIIVQGGPLARDWPAEHTSGYEHIVDKLNIAPVVHCAETCGMAEDKLRAAAWRIASASSVSALEDLGVQMNLHSTLGSYLQRLVWLLTGHYGCLGTSNAFVSFLSLSKAGEGDTSMSKKGVPRVEKRSPVANAKIIIGLTLYNVIPEETLTDHSERHRAMLVEAGNPLHSLADSQRMREVMRALELPVVIDVTTVEIARHTDYMLPATSQLERAEATFLNLEFPRNVFHLRALLFLAHPDTLPEAEIHARLLEVMGVLGERDYRPLRLALKLGRKAFPAAFLAAVATRPKVMKYVPVLFYRILGLTLPAGTEAAAAIWGICQLHVLNNRKAAARAGFDGLPPLAVDHLFQAMFDNPSGVVFAETTYAESWQAVARPEQWINLHIPELLPELAKLAHSALPHDPAYPFILTAGERRSDANSTVVCDAGWHRHGRYGILRISPQGVKVPGCANGEMLRVVTRYGDVEAEVEINDMIQPGSISLPNGQGLDYRNAEGEVARRGVVPNEVTDCTQRDFLAGTPWHKYVPARLGRLATPVATNA